MRQKNYEDLTVEDTILVLPEAINIIDKFDHQGNDDSDDEFTAVDETIGFMHYNSEIKNQYRVLMQYLLS